MVGHISASACATLYSQTVFVAHYQLRYENEPFHHHLSISFSFCFSLAWILDAWSSVSLYRRWMFPSGSNSAVRCEKLDMHNFTVGFSILRKSERIVLHIANKQTSRSGVWGREITKSQQTKLIFRILIYTMFTLNYTWKSFASLQLQRNCNRLREIEGKLKNSPYTKSSTSDIQYIHKYMRAQILRQTFNGAQNCAVSFMQFEIITIATARTCKLNSKKRAEALNDCCMWKFSGQKCNQLPGT